MRAALLLHETSLKEQAKAETKAVTGKSTHSAIRVLLLNYGAPVAAD
jgi:hypothetical protein